jgi:hypothetical protein
MLREKLGWMDVHVGDASFDQRYCVRGSDEELIRWLLGDPQVRSALDAFFGGPELKGACGKQTFRPLSVSLPTYFGTHSMIISKALNHTWNRCRGFLYIAPWRPGEHPREAPLLAAGQLGSCREEDGQANRVPHHEGAGEQLRESSVAFHSVSLAGPAVLLLLTLSCSRAEAESFDLTIRESTPAFYEEVPRRLKDRIHECAALFRSGVGDCVNVWVRGGSVYNPALSHRTAVAMAKGKAIFVLTPADGVRESTCESPACLCVTALLLDAYKDDGRVTVSLRKAPFHLNSVAVLRCAPTAASDNR